MNLQITPVESPQDITIVAALAREIWHEFYVPLIGREQVEYMVSNFQSAVAIRRQLEEGYEYFLVRRNGAAVGYCGLRAEPQEGQLFLSKFYLHRDARGTGTGRACMEFIENLALQRGLGTLWLTVNKGNPSVQAYERMGFRKVSELVMDIGAGFVMDDFRMEKPLT